MTTIQQSHTRWVPSTLMAIACMAVCMLLSVNAARADTPRASPRASTSSTTSQLAQSAPTAHAAAAHTLASRRHTLRTCERIHPGHCATAQRAVERAAARLAATLARSARSNHRSPARTPAHGVPVTPPAQSGASGSGSSSSGSTSGSSDSGSSSDTGSGSSSSSGSESSSGTGGTPSPQETPSSTQFEPGINSGSAALWELPGAVKLAAKLVRIDMGVGQTVQELEPIIGGYAADGIRVLPLADFHGTMPTPEEASNLANWAKAFGPGGSFWAGRSDGQFAIHAIEFGNETSYSYQYSNDTPSGYASRAQTYALRFAEAATAMRSANPGVGLLAQGDAGNAGSLWVENMFKAVPNLGQLVAGWTIHPYGPGWRPRLQALISETAAQGAQSTIPVDITEWGLTTDNGRCLEENYGWNKCMTYTEAGEDLTRTVKEMHEVLGSRFGMLLLYKIRDQKATGASTEREAYFGALQSELQPKGAYTTAVEQLLDS
jgi:hypothetical protein